MKLKKIKDRINYLKTELVHKGFHDGWVINGIKKELIQLNKKLDEFGESNE